MILQIYRETIAPGREGDFDSIERDTARNAARLGCPNPYLAAEAMRGAKVVWWFNAYDSTADQRRVAQSYMHNAKLMAAMARNSSHKAEFTGDTSDVFAHARPDASGGLSWTPGLGRFLCVIETKGSENARGAVFETDDGTRFIITACTTREAAEKSAKPQTHVLKVRPEWSFPSPAWVAADKEFWA